MRNSSSKSKSIADPGASHVELRFYPYAKETQAVVVVAHGLGSRASRLRVWSGLLPASRGDLHGLDAGAVTVLLTGLLRDAIADPTGHAVAWRTDDHSAEGPAVPLGTSGGTVTQLELDLDPYPSYTPPGIDGGVYSKKRSANVVANRPSAARS
jgi:hypothetical protein